MKGSPQQQGQQKNEPKSTCEQSIETKLKILT
jgi:hypothetical protein